MDNEKYRCKIFGFNLYFYLFPFTFFLLYLSGCATAPYQPPQAIGIPPKTGGIYYEVVRGDTLWQISKTYGVGLSEIVKANGLSDISQLNAGQRLFIPGAKSVIPVISARYQKDLFIWPCEGKIISYFGQELYGTANKGVDIRAEDDAKIVASKDGRVIFCGEKVKGLGKTIIIDHANGFCTLYARNSHNLVKAGDIVRQGQIIAKAGATGRGTSPSLHFEIRRRSKPQNPIYYLP